METEIDYFAMDVTGIIRYNITMAAAFSEFW